MLRADTTSLRIALAAPALGSAVVVIPLFMLSDFGVPLKYGGPPVLGVVLAATAIVLAIRRPRLPRPAFVVALIALVHLVLAGRPMIRFGFHWLANANGDMTYYVLSATALLTSPLRDPVDHAALARDQDLATVAHTLHELGVRVGSDVVLSSLAASTGRFAADLYMPLILSVSMVGVCAAGSVAMQFASRARAAVIAAALLAVSPLATYGVMQQLLPQVWGLALGAALVALLMRPELHARARAPVAEMVPVWILAIALFVVYVELAASLVVSYVLYLVLLAARRTLSPVGVLRLWIPAVVGVVLVVSLYLPRAVHFLTLSANAGVTKFGSLRLFVNAIVPTAVAGVAGFQSLFASPSAPLMSVSILAALLLLSASLVAAVVTARRGVAASVVIVGDVILGLLLAVERSDFGLFKLYMYIQPFLAAAVGVWIAGIRSRAMLSAVAAVAVLVVAVQVNTQADYVSKTFNPVDLRHASDADLLPAFRSLVARAQVPVLSVTDNAPLTALEGAAASAADRPLQFVSSNPFDLPSTEQTFRLATPHRKPVTFIQPRGALALLGRDRCNLAMPSGSQWVLNRRQLREGMPDLVPLDCARPRNLLAFVVSSVGNTFYAKKDVSLWQLERDPMFPGRTMSGFGRYALLEAVNPTPGARLELDFSTTFLRDPSLSFRLPRATVAGAGRFHLPVTGVGSARVFSPPLRPQIIGGHTYFLLDMGRDGFFPPVPRPGVTGLWGASVHVDPRILTSYVRNISLVSSRDYRSMAVPSSIDSLPHDLANENLEYSGIFEDGWLGRDSYVVLAPRGASQFVLQADVVPAAGQRLTVTMNGTRVWSKLVAPGELEIHLPMARHARKVVIRLHWAVAKPLGPRDPRPAPARVRFLGFAPPPSVLAALPRDLSRPGVETKGVFADGWLERRSSFVLAAGPAANFVMRADVPPLAGTQHLRVLVDGHPIWSRPIAPGAVEVRAPVGVATTARRVDIVWSRARAIGPRDPRRASARLTYLGIVRIRALRRLTVPRDLRDPRVSYSGLSLDGWAGRRVDFVLAGGPAATLVVHAEVPRLEVGQRLTVAVDGVVAGSRPAPPGRLNVRLPIRSSTRPRHVELRWSTVTQLAPPDQRKAAARLSYIGVLPLPAGVRVP